MTSSDPPLDTKNIQEWRIAKKTKSIRAKPVINLLVDKSVLNKFLITTLEANEPLGDGSIVCLGDAGDMWQQMPNKLLDKYIVESIDSDGWMVCKPKEDNSIECFEVDFPIDTDNKEHFVKALWGALVGEETCQSFGRGDYICRNRTDTNDVWVVRKKFFENTYTIIG